jgi:putative flippase GtrA
MLNTFSRFLLVGAGSTAINFIIFLLAQLLHYPIFLSSIFGYFVGVINSYYWGSKWVHLKIYKIEMMSFGKFCLLYGVNGIIVGLIIQELQLLYAFDYRLCWIIGTLYGVIGNFVGQKFLIFNED